MRRLISLLVVLGVAGLPALAQSYYTSPDIPTDLAGTTYLPWEVVRVDSGLYSPWLWLPANTAVDSLHAMCGGNWLLSVEAHTELPPGGGVFYEPWDVVEYDPGTGTYSSFFCGGPVGIPPGSDIDAAFLRGNDAADLVISFDVPTDLTALGGSVYDPADLIQFQRFGAGCASWTLVGLFFDATAAAPAIPVTTNVTGADRFGAASMLPFDVPTTLAATYLPGQVAAWDSSAAVFFLFDAPPWPADLSSRMDAFSRLPGPGEVPWLTVNPSTTTPGDLTIAWSPSTSVGAEDYGIYEGAITHPWVYSHAQVVCTDAGTPLTEDVTPGAGDRYYLVVALNPDAEGSYGRRANGLERPPGSPSCRPVQDLDCP